MYIKNDACKNRNGFNSLPLFFTVEIITESMKAGEKKEKKTKEKTEKIEDVANDVDAQKKAEPEKKGDPPVIEGKLEDVVSWLGRCFKQTVV